MSQQHNRTVAAIDLGATSGRVMAGWVDGHGVVQLEAVHRFANGPVPAQGAGEGALAWDIDELWAQIRHGLKLAFAQYPDIASIGVDSWAVDYALLAAGQRLGGVRHYRDARNEQAVPVLERHFSREQLFDINGLQYLPFNTMYQLQAEQADDRLRRADTLLLVPDYINYLLTGQARIEWTNASTTGLLNQHTGSWDAGLSRHLGLAGKLPPLVQPGQVVGTLTESLAAELCAGPGVQVLATASHDTASAVAATPLSTSRSAYVSCGTWGLVGVELDAPVLTSAAQQAGFTNELGIDGTVRFLKNVTGTFLLSECLADWGLEPSALAGLLDEAADLEVPGTLFDPQDDAFLAPGNMPQRVADAVAAAGGAAPECRAATLRLVVESLAASFAKQAFTAAAFGGFEPDAIHIVGGGSQGALLCQRTADYAGVPVVAGPVECTALGNVLVQLRALAKQPWEPGRLRELVRTSVPQHAFLPAG